MSKLTHKSNEKFVGAASSRPHFRERAKKENGITLIALIITIIVILILTGVTLSITLGDNGLVNKAKEASTQTQVAMDRELLLSAVVGAMGNDGKVNLSAINLPEGFTGSDGTYTSKNGNAFTVSENGEIVYTGSDNVTENGDEIQTGEIDLSGKYYLMYPELEYYYEIINNSVMVGVTDDGETDSIPIDIDYEKQTISITSEYEEGSYGEVVTRTIVFNYDLVIENNKVVNIILADYSDYTMGVFYQNKNGFEYDLEGTYINEEFNDIITFTKGSEEVNGRHEYQPTNIDEFITYYFKCNGKYYFDIVPITVDESKEHLVIYGENYTKQ